MNALTPIDIFDPSSYPTRRDEEWHYSDLKRHMDKIGVPVLSDDVLPNVPHTVTITPEKSGVIYEWSNVSKKTPVFERVDYNIEPGASLTRVVVLDETMDATTIRQSEVRVAPGGTYKQYVFSTGAAFQRFETHVHHMGQGAEVELNGAYLLKGKTHFDYTTRITHAGRDGVTRQLIKGLVKDQATGVFQGRILVERGADGTDARMHHQALMLNDGAHIRAKPELEIYADDVQCAHGNTIGALDEAALFFCMSRGMSEAVARSLLTQAFVLPVAEMIEDEQLREKVLTFLTEKAEAFHGL